MRYGTMMLTAVITLMAVLMIGLTQAATPAQPQAGDGMTETRAPNDPDGEWVFVEKITVGGVQNSLPEGESIKRIYPAGTHKFKLRDDTLGISYSVPQGFHYTAGCFIMALENVPASGVYHCLALSQVDGTPDAVLSTTNAIEARFFIMDWYRGDNNGFVMVDVYRRE